VIRLRGGVAVIKGADPAAVRAAFRDVLEIAVKIGGDWRGLRLSFWQDGLPIQIVPRDGSFGALVAAGLGPARTG